MNNLTYVISQGPREKQSYSEEEDVINEGLPLEGCSESGNQHEYLASSTSTGGGHSYSEAWKARKMLSLHPGDREATNKSHGHVAMLGI